MDGMYLIPANSKKSALIFGLFRWIDVGIFLGGVGFSFITFLIVNPGDIWTMVLVFLPAAICALLVMPVPYQHNVLVTITNVIKYFSNRRIYKWRGWCVGDGSDDK